MNSFFDAPRPDLMTDQEISTHKRSGIKRLGGTVVMMSGFASFGAAIVTESVPIAIASLVTTFVGGIMMDRGDKEIYDLETRAGSRPQAESLPLEGLN